MMLAAASLSGCAGSTGSFPSLAPRPIENLSLTEPDRPAPALPVADPASIARYAPLITQAQSDDAAFHRVLDEERSTLLRSHGAAIGSDAWTAAQVSISRVQTARGAVAKTLADLDAARSGDNTLADSGAAVASQKAFETVQRIDDEEEAAVAAVTPGR